MNYLTRHFKDLPPGKRLQALNELISEFGSVPKSAEEDIKLVLMSDYTGQAEERLKLFGQMQGLSTGYSKLDDLTKGLVGGELVIVAGKTSYGKTTLAMNIANKVALKKHSVLFVTLEMTPVELTSRFMHVNGGVNDAYYDAAASILFQAKDELSWQSIDALIGKAVTEMNIELVIIDHLHYFTRELEHVSEDLGRITKEFKKNAIRHNVPVMLISHVRKTNADANMEDLRGSSYVAQDADIVLMVGRDTDKPNSLMVKIEKNRNRGFDHQENIVELYLDQVRLTNDEPINLGAVFG